MPTPIPGDPPIPLYNPEVALKSVMPSVARTLGLVTLGTFNERQGDQLLLHGDVKVGAWGRARASGSVHGSVDGFDGAPAGHVDLNASSYAGYWTHLGPSNWYVDAVLQWTYVEGNPTSVRGDSNNIRGRELAGSVEAGYPIALTPWLTVEPQIQGIWQRVSFDDTQVSFSTITFDRSYVFTGRAGGVLRGSFGSIGALWQPYLKGNKWWGTNGFDTVRFNDIPIQTGRNGGTALEGGGGITGKLTSNLSVYADASYLGSVSGEQRITIKGNAGLRVTW